MTKITEAGSLYLDDYHILNEAYKDMSKFLDEILINVHSNLISKLKELNNDTYKWSIWLNKSSLGLLEIQLRLNNNKFDYINNDKVILYIEYRDIRRTSRISKPQTIELGIIMNGHARNLGVQLNSRSMLMSGNKILDRYYINLDLESTETCVDNITSEALNYCAQVMQLIDEIN